jgi:hypothetical protein
VKISRIVRSGSLVGVGPAGLPPPGLRTFETVDADPTGVLVRPAGSLVCDRAGARFWLNTDGTAAGWILSHRLAQRVGGVGAACTSIDVVLPTPLVAASGYRLTFRGTNPLGSAVVYSLRVNGSAANISRSGYYGFAGSAPATFGDATGALASVAAGCGYDIELELMRPRSVDRTGKVILFVQMHVDGTPADLGFFGWFSANGVGIDIGSMGYVASIANGIAATSTYQLKVI